MEQQPDYTELYERIVDRLRQRGWSRFDAEGEALARVTALRDKEIHRGFART